VEENEGIIDRRFVKKIRINAECWEWTGHIDRYGYGRLGREGRGLIASRYAYEQAFGPIPPGMFVCHKCDNRACVRPSHLFVGSCLENHQDAWGKGRGRPASRPLVLNPEVVREIRRLYAVGETSHRQLARQFGCGRTTIGAVLSRRSWGHVE
jgi:hypothetical protein